MSEGMRGNPLLEEIPELLHHIQMRLPVKEAARTSVLSKSWLHAWSTIPTLRFLQTVMSLSEEQETEHLKVIDHTLTRYLHNNIPIKRIYLKIDTENQESSSLAQKWIPPVATKSCLKGIYLFIVLSMGSFTLPDEILSSKNLTRLRVTACFSKTHSLLMTTLSVINSVSLRKLQLKNVHISQEVIHDIFSTCRLLVDVDLLYCKGFDNIKIKNLGCLKNLKIYSYERNSILEISDAPNLRFFWCVGKPLSFNTEDSFGRVTHLWLGYVVMDEALLDMIKLKFPLLQSLTLYMGLWRLDSFHLTCASLKRLSLNLCPLRLINIQVNAPKLHSFCFEGKKIPSLLFPASANSLLTKIKLVLHLKSPIDASFFLKMRKALELSNKREIEITMNNTVILPPFEVDILNLREMVELPALNVERLWFKTTGDEGLWESSPFFDAFFFICHPKHVVAKPDTMFNHNNHFCKLMVTEVMEKKNTKKARKYLNWPYYLKDF